MTIVQMLLANGASVLDEDFYGQTAIDVAVKCSDSAPEVLKTLLKHDSREDEIELRFACGSFLKAVDQADEAQVSELFVIGVDRNYGGKGHVLFISLSYGGPPTYCNSF